MKLVDPLYVGKTYTTREGGTARIANREGALIFPFQGQVFTKNGEVVLETWNVQGRVVGQDVEDEHDLLHST